MHLISYDQFGKLRLRDFVPEGTIIGEAVDWEWEGSLWYNEGIGFTSFSRHVSTPDQTGGLEILFEEMPADSVQSLLSAIGLPLRPGMNAAEVLSVMGTPTETNRYVADRCSSDFSVGDPERYIVGCTVHSTQGLIFLTVVRPDLMVREE